MTKLNHYTTTLIKNNEEYYEFIRELRFHPKNIHGFLDKNLVSSEQQKKYMEKYGKYYFICVYNKKPVGFVGVVENDIRICTHPDFKKKNSRWNNLRCPPKHSSPLRLRPPTQTNIKIEFYTLDLPLEREI